MTADAGAVRVLRGRDPIRSWLGEKPAPSSLDMADRDKPQRITDRVASRGPSAIPRLEARNESEDAVLVGAVDQNGQNLGVSDRIPPPPGETRRADGLVEEIRRPRMLAHTGLNIEAGQQT